MLDSISDVDTIDARSNSKTADAFCVIITRVNNFTVSQKLALEPNHTFDASLN